jgi:hypothetical protein
MNTKTTTIDRRRLLLGTGATAAALGAVSTLPATELTETTEEMTDDQLAAHPFEAWVHTPDEWKPPTNVKWANLANPHLISIRMAWLIMHKTKPELIEMVKGMDPDLFMTMFRNHWMRSSTGRWHACTAWAWAVQNDRDAPNPVHRHDADPAPADRNDDREPALVARRDRRRREP